MQPAIGLVTFVITFAHTSFKSVYVLFTPLSIYRTHYIETNPCIFFSSQSLKSLENLTCLIYLENCIAVKRMSLSTLEPIININACIMHIFKEAKIWWGKKLAIVTAMPMINSFKGNDSFSYREREREREPWRYLLVRMTKTIQFCAKYLQSLYPHREREIHMIIYSKLWKEKKNGS